MKAGSMVNCPHCGGLSVVKSVPEMEGWRVTGGKLVCALCGAKLGEPEPEAPDPESGARQRLSALLGGEEKTEAAVLDDGSGRDFCCNCRHLIASPFRLVCGRSGGDTDPMASCRNFEAKK